MAQIPQKLYFWIALIKIFRLMYNLLGFAVVRIFHCFSDDVISYHWLSELAYFVEHNIGYKPSKF